MTSLRDRVIEALQTVHDPEIPVNVYDLGLIYNLDINDDGNVAVTMTLTAPNCPVAEDIVRDVRTNVARVEGVTNTDVSLVFEPAWGPHKMSEDGRLILLAMGVDPDRAKETLVNRPTGLTVGRRKMD